MFFILNLKHHQLVEDDGMDFQNTPAEVTPPVRGRGRARGRAKTAASGTTSRGRGRGRGASKLSPKVDEDEAEITVVSGSDDDFVPSKQTATPRQVAKSSRGTRARGAGGAISQAFARQSQITTQASQRTAPAAAASSPAATTRTSARPKASTTRGVCYVSDSD